MRIGSTILAHDRGHRTHPHRVAAYPTEHMAPRRRAACLRTGSPFTTYWCILRMPSRDVREHLPQHRGICMTQSARPFPNLSSVLRWLRQALFSRFPQSTRKSVRLQKRRGALSAGRPKEAFSWRQGGSMRLASTLPRTMTPTVPSGSSHVERRRGRTRCGHQGDS